ncbi:MAG TPA: AAA family ATPase [Candidatus Dormibacteraeota bacterium]|nr:AAA family ATPase [Candidatus Dormibacteraeota bacterium]
MDDFVGREVELSRVLGRLRDAGAGRGRLVLVGGDAGIGKTRLAEEVARRARAMSIPVAWGRAVETEGAPAFWPWRQVLRDLATQCEPAELRAAAGTHGPALARLSSEVGRALGVQPGPPTDASEDRFALFEGIADFLRRCAERGGLLVVLDDAHWADEPSVLLLSHLAGELTRTRVVVLVTHRGADDDAGAAHLLIALSSARSAERFHLVGLDRAATARQLEGIVGSAVGAAMVDKVHAMTDGNPFFTLEMARLMVATAATDVDAAAVGDVPPSVREVVRRRLAAVTAEGRALLDAASVVGREFDADTLAVMTDRSAVSVSDALDGASRLGILVPGVAAGTLRFSHLLVRETLYADLDVAARRRLHARAAEALDWLHAHRLDPHLAAIARHRTACATTGEDARTAAAWLVRAAQAAMDRLAWEEAVRLDRLALEVAGDRFDAEERAGALIALATGLARSGELAESLRQCTAASRCAATAGRPDLMAAAALVLEGVSEPEWNAALALLCDDALRELPADAVALRARLLAQRTTWRLMAGEYAGAVEASEVAVSLAEESGDDAALLAAMRVRHTVSSGPEGLEERRRIAERLLDLGMRSGGAEPLLWGRLWRIEAALDAGDLAAARRDVEALGGGDASRSHLVARWHLHRLRSILAEARGDFDDAVAAAERAREVMSRADHTQASALYDAFRHGALAWFRGADPDATESIRGHLARVPDAYAPLVRISLVSVLLWSGRRDEARAEYRLLPPLDATPLPGVAQFTHQAFRATAAAELGECADALALYATLLPYRDRHLGGSGPEYRGCVELVLGVVARHCGDRATSIGHLRRALAAHRLCGSPPFAVATQCELADVLVEADPVGNRREARALATEALAAARRLGMPPFVTRAEGFLETRARPDASPLSRREEEVAALVARGLTSRQIATALHLSERTAQNHVQHILDKLGFASRSQIAAWFAARTPPGEG